MEWVPWSSPDHLRVLVVRGEVDFVGMPLTTAALFREKGIPIRFLGGSLGNVLHVLTTEPVVDGLSGMQGRTIAVPMRGEYPDMMFRALLERADMEGSIRIQYTATSQDAANQLRVGAVDGALVAEPHCSILLARMSDRFYRAVDIQEEWNRTTGSDTPLVTAGLVAVGSMVDEEEILAAFWNVYQEAATWCLMHPFEAVELLGSSLPDEDARIGAGRALASCARIPVPSGTERPILEEALQLFRSMEPEAFAAAIPEDEFFWQPYIARGEAP